MTDLTTALLAYLDTPYTLGLKLLYEAGEWDQLATMRMDPARYLDCVSGASRFFRDGQGLALFSKRDDLDTSFDKERVAYDDFQKMERHCCEYNHTLSVFTSDLRNDDQYAPGRMILSRAKKWILRAWGRVPDSLNGRFGPGKTAELKGAGRATVADKMSESSVTPGALPIWAHTTTVDGLGRILLENQPFLTRGNELAFVPKSSKTMRTIAMEPGGNLYCQLGVGGHLKRRLAALGLGVKPSDAVPLHKRIARSSWDYPEFLDGQLLHRALAREGSRQGTYATVDFSSASSTISVSLVRALLEGSPWLDLLTALRSPFTKLPKKYGGHWVRNEAFSTMGNGFTFELLTSVIAALVHGSTGLIPGKDFWVYGDDLVVPTLQAARAVQTLQLFGFIANVGKTYVSGAFRESCGGDFLDGFNVRPKFLKTGFSGLNPIKVVDFHNTFHFHPVTASVAIRRGLRALVPRSLRFENRRLTPYCFHTRRVTRSHSSGGIVWVRGIRAESSTIPVDRWGNPSWRWYAQLLSRTECTYPQNGSRKEPHLSVRSAGGEIVAAWFSGS